MMGRFSVFLRLRFRLCLGALGSLRRAFWRELILGPGYFLGLICGEFVEFDDDAERGLLEDGHAHGLLGDAVHLHIVADVLEVEGE